MPMSSEPSERLGGNLRNSMAQASRAAKNIVYKKLGKGKMVAKAKKSKKSY